MRNKNYKSVLCMMVFAIVSLHSFLLHGHHDACAPDTHLHAFAPCEQMDVFVPADDAGPGTAPLFCLVPSGPFRMGPAVSPCREILSDCSDPFIAADGPDSGGPGLRAPPAV